MNVNKEWNEGVRKTRWGFLVAKRVVFIAFVFPLSATSNEHLQSIFIRFSIWLNALVNEMSLENICANRNHHHWTLTNKLEYTGFDMVRCYLRFSSVALLFAQCTSAHRKQYFYIDVGICSRRGHHHRRRRRCCRIVSMMWVHITYWTPKSNRIWIWARVRYFCRTNCWNCKLV